jgi:hypothetical protein
MDILFCIIMFCTCTIQFLYSDCPFSDILSFTSFPVLVQCIHYFVTTLYNISDFTLISGKRETHKLFGGKRRKSRQVVGMDTHMGPSYMRKHVWHMFNFNQLHSTWFVHSDCIIFMFYVCYFSIFLDLEIWGSRNEQEWVSDFGKCMRHREVYSRWILVIGNLPL